MVHFGAKVTNAVIIIGFQGGGTVNRLVKRLT